MEWVAEGVTHVSVGTLAVLIAVAGYAGTATGDLVYRVLAGMLVVLAVLTAQRREVSPQDRPLLPRDKSMRLRMDRNGPSPHRHREAAC
jgi:hypothetical protein